MPIGEYAFCDNCGTYKALPRDQFRGSIPRGWYAVSQWDEDSRRLEEPKVFCSSECVVEAFAAAVVLTTEAVVV